MPRLASLVCVLGLVGCAGSQLRREPVGQRAALVQMRGQPELAAGAGSTIQLPRGRYEVALRFDVPRAQIVDYTIACGAIESPAEGGRAAAPEAMRRLIEQRGRAGETFEAYRARRLAELNRQQDRDRAAAASAASMVAGIVAPSVTMTGQTVASGPQGSATMETTVSTHAVRDAAGGVAADAFPPITELAPTDLGAARLQARATVMVPADATCVVRVLADDAHVLAGYDVTRVRDLEQEARERQVAATANAHAVRGQLTARLVAAGADPLARQRRHEAEARARAEEAARQAELQATADAERRRKDAAEEARRAELRAAADAERRRKDVEAEARRAELRAAAEAEWSLREAERRRAEDEARQRAHAIQIELEARLSIALEVRASLVAYLAGTCHADPHKRARERAAELRLREERELKLRLELQARLDLEARVRAEREARLRLEREQRAAREAKLRAEREARLRLEREQRAAREAAARRRVELALGARVELQTFLASIGARQRPPMPALVVETSGAPPFEGARWSAGRWEWNRAEWIWIRGGWTDATVFGDAGSSGPVVARSAPVVETPIVVETPTVHVTSPVVRPVARPVGATVTVELPPPAVTTTITTTVTTDTPVVRDHRTVRPPPPPRTRGSAPTVRDHRKRAR